MSYQFVIIHNNAPIYNCCFTYTWVNIRVYIIHLFNQHATDVKIRLSKYSSQIQSTNGPEIRVEEMFVQRELWYWVGVIIAVLAMDSL